MGKMAFIEPVHSGLELILHKDAVIVMFLYTPTMESLRQINTFDLTMALEDWSLRWRLDEP